MNPIIIKARRWFQKSYGNTYHRVIDCLMCEKLREDYLADMGLI